MNQKKARMLRNATKYNPGDDPIHERKYSTFLTKKTQDTGGGRPIRITTGRMIATKGERLTYRQAKKLYREGKI